MKPISPVLFYSLKIPLLINDCGLFEFFVQQFQPLVGYRNFFQSFLIFSFNRIAGQTAFIAGDFSTAVDLKISHQEYHPVLFIGKMLHGGNRFQHRCDTYPLALFYSSYQVMKCDHLDRIFMEILKFDRHFLQGEESPVNLYPDLIQLVVIPLQVTVGNHDRF